MTCPGCGSTSQPNEGRRTCYDCGCALPRPRVSVAVDSEPHEASLAASCVSPAASDALVGPKGLAMLLDSMTLMGARNIKVKAGWRLILELRQALDIKSPCEWFLTGGVAYEFDSSLPERGVSVHHE